MFLDCPAWLDNDGTVRCGLPAEVKRRYITRSTDGAPRKHHDQLPCRALVQRPIEYLTQRAATSTRRALPEPLPAPCRDSLADLHDGRRNSSGRRPDHC